MCAAWKCGWGWALAAEQDPVLAVATLHHFHQPATRGKCLLRGAARLLCAGEMAEASMGSPLEEREGPFQ